VRVAPSGNIDDPNDVTGSVRKLRQEYEEFGCLIMNEKVADVAVFGLPDPEMGEFVQAVVQLAPGVQPTAEMGDELKSFIRSHLAGYKVPRRIDFREDLPRLQTGKLAKHILRKEYLAAATG
jgi:long-chain acyl-CoA synthetase